MHHILVSSWEYVDRLARNTATLPHHTRNKQRPRRGLQLRIDWRIHWRKVVEFSNCLTLISLLSSLNQKKREIKKKAGCSICFPSHLSLSVLLRPRLWSACPYWVLAQTWWSLDSARATDTQREVRKLRGGGLLVGRVESDGFSLPRSPAGPERAVCRYQTAQTYLSCQAAG